MAPAWACSSVVEHCVDIAGVASSILATPTIRKPRKSADFRGFLVSERPRFRAPARPNLTNFDQFSPNDLGTWWARRGRRQSRKFVARLGQMHAHSEAVATAGSRHSRFR